MAGHDLTTGRRRTTALLAVLLLAVFAWSYWPTFGLLLRRWSSDPQYTHGYIVPLFAGFVLYLRRDRFPGDAMAVSWLGVPVLVLAVLCRLLGTLYSFEWLEAGSLLVALVGGCLLIGGPALVRWAWPAGVLLLFVLPWPWQLDMLLTQPLRRVATIASTYALQTMGVPALARGNIIVVNDLEVGVVEACSGLGMLMTFFALATAVAFVIERPLFHRIVIFLSAAPIGVLMNVIRITVTVWLYRIASPELARVVFHDVAGWVMMPMALLVMWLELWLLARLWRPAPDVRPGGPVIQPDPFSGHAPRRGPELKSRTETTAERPLEEIRDVVP